MTRTRNGTLLRAAPWIGILLAVAIVQLVREQSFDAAVFGLAAGALVLDATGAVPVRRRRPSIPLAALIAAAASVGTALALAPRHGLVAGIAVAAVGVVGVPLAWLLPPAGDAPRGARVRRAAIAWGGVAVVLCLVELWSFLLGRTAATKGDHPAISELLDPVLDTQPGRLVFLAAWLAVGVLLLTRGRRRPDA